MGQDIAVSVVIPAYNAAAYIGDAIQSVLNQSENVEIIVVDDGSTDGTAREAARFGDAIHLVRFGRNQGIPDALNAGLEQARGAIIGFLDADDIWPPKRLHVGLELMSRGIAPICWGRTQILFIDRAGGGWSTSPEWPPRHYPSLGAILFRKDVFARVGGFDPQLRHALDIDLLARIMEAGIPIHRHDDIALHWRRHQNNITNNVQLDRDYFLSALQLAMQRRRATARRDSPNGAKDGVQSAAPLRSPRSDR
ncbi:MAG TPA: glycosyltransferase [Allosphingosinicella sp.]|nr:glycosyltransferase [Allosphingosinicella sp.]